MKVEIVEAQTISELDKLINSCVESRTVSDIKLSTTLMHDNSIKYTALIIMNT